MAEKLPVGAHGLVTAERRERSTRPIANSTATTVVVGAPVVPVSHLVFHIGINAWSMAPG
jgi:hypothetical protein